MLHFDLNPDLWAQPPHPEKNYLDLARPPTPKYTSSYIGQLFKAFGLITVSVIVCNKINKCNRFKAGQVTRRPFLHNQIPSWTLLTSLRISEGWSVWMRGAKPWFASSDLH